MNFLLFFSKRKEMSHELSFRKNDSEFAFILSNRNINSEFSLSPDADEIQNVKLCYQFKTLRDKIRDIKNYTSEKNFDFFRYSRRY